MKSFTTNNIVSSLSGVGLFLATVAVCQLIQIHYKPGNKEDEEEEERRRRQSFRKAFHLRKLSRRLSFQKFERTKEEEDNEVEGINSVDDNLDHVHFRNDNHSTEFSLHSTTNHTLSKSDERRTDHENTSGRHRQRPVSIIPSNDRYHDFHPKYQNWRHFEHCNEHDKSAKKRRKKRQDQNAILQQQRQEQQKQDAGEVASQQQQQRQQLTSEIECARAAATTSTTTPAIATGTIGGQSNAIIEDHLRTTIKVPLNELEKLKKLKQQQQHNQVVDTDARLRQSMMLCVDNGSDNSIATFSDDADDEKSTTSNAEDISSTESFRLRNQFGWVGAGGQCSSSKNAANKKEERTATLPLIYQPKRRPIRVAVYDSRSSSSSISSNSHSNNHRRTTSEDRIGRFQRFCQMLTMSDDDNQKNSSSGTTTILPSSMNSSVISVNVDDEDGDDDDDAETHHRVRTEYNARIMPEKLVLIRHGQSAGNINETLYSTTPDNAMPLTDLGWEQARKAGKILKEKIITPGESVNFIVSPYVRTVETFHGLVSAWCDPESDEFAGIDDHNRKVNAWYDRLRELGLTWNEDSRIREQDFGNYQNPEKTKRAKEERHRFGAFYYRFNNGESGSDVFDRVSTFLDSLWRSFETNKSQNYVLVTHGIVLRVLMTRYFRYTISQLNMLANPRNCEMVVLGQCPGEGRLDLEGRCDLKVKEDKETKESRVIGYTFHKRLRILPKSHIRTVKFRISPNDKVL